MQSDAGTFSLSFDDFCGTLPRSSFVGCANHTPATSLARSKDAQTPTLTCSQRETIAQTNDDLQAQMASPSLSDLAKALAQRLKTPIRLRTAQGPALRHGIHAPQLSHAFIIINHLEQGTEALIVDPAFREQFQIGLQDKLYASQLEEHVPELFIGTASEMGPLIRRILRWMHAAFHRREISIPFWRNVEAMTSQWQPVEYSDQIYTLASADPKRQQRQKQKQQAATPVSSPVVCQPAPSPFSAAAQPPLSPALPRLRPPPLTPQRAEPRTVVFGFDLAPSSSSQAQEERQQPASSGALRADTISLPLPFDRQVRISTSPPPHGSTASTASINAAPVRSISAPLSLAPSRRSAAPIKAH